MARISNISNILILFFTNCLVGCGGGAADQPVEVEAVGFVTEADLLAAGVPELPIDSAAAAVARPGGQRSSSITSNMDHWEFVDAGNGRLSIGPSELPARRILGWALYSSSADEAGENLALAMQLSSSGASQYRVFPAVGNYSTGRWEIGGRIIIDVIGAGFSLGNDYVSPQGKVYMLVVVGHPGTANPPSSPLVLDLPQVKWTGPSIVSEQYTAQISQPGPGNVLIHINPKSGAESQVQMDYDFSSFAGRLLPAFPVESGLSGFKGSDEELQVLWRSGLPQYVNGVHDADHPPLILEESHIGFFNIGELNGSRHPYTIRGWSEGDFNGDGFAINEWEIPVPAGSVGAELRGILIGDAGNDMVVASGANVQLSDMQGSVLASTVADAQGRFSLGFSQPGEYILGWSWGMANDSHKVTAQLIDSDGSQVGLRARFSFEPMPE